MSGQSSAPIWRRIQRQNFNNWEKLADYLKLDASQRQSLLVRPGFPLNLPLRLAEKICKGTLDDPIFRQFVPLVEETLQREGFVLDPVGDKSFRKETKLLHKYQGRALLVCTSACAMHCRYCFRQNFDYESEELSFAKELELIRQDSTLHEVILSGGDPLSLGDEALGRLLEGIGDIPHVKRIRFHTRFPIGIPERITAGFLKLLENSRCQIWFVIHSNHPRELDLDILGALKDIQRLGIPLLNQAVLLKGVNDDVSTLKELCQVLVDHGISPYYLHQLDRVQGAAHFEVEEALGKTLVQELIRQLPGYAVPKYVREIPGEASKAPLL